MIDVEKAITTTVKTGKVLFGASSAVNVAKTGKARLIIIASNCPSHNREDIEHYCKLSNIPMVTYKGSSMDLGAVCGKPFSISVLTIREPGDSDIMKLRKATNV